ncbi:MAG: hypothetical protein HY287_17880 [Planctomycetes bacterium]|nr:hypothetical protein [Planctomycetota bacterium]MBI3836194.1 hypothetical protein [Planctomycetota bacterium]
MGFETRGEAVIGAHSLEELKLVYRILHRHLGEHVELMDTHFLIELQNYLHRMAGEQGVDSSNHGAWDQWLGNVDAPACDVRMQGRGRIEPSS